MLNLFITTELVAAFI